ncbi:hypothetical protein [Alkalihalobacillus sp. R86527]|uniref:hypothetical protein n=1 Tax=Alkalihalobacillus sp. R86527 TaxID=3093863 RepID=UPI00366CF1D6
MFNKIRKVIGAVFIILMIIFVSNGKDVAFNGTVIVFFLFMCAERAIISYREKNKRRLIMEGTFTIAFVVMLIAWVVSVMKNNWAGVF